MSVFIRERYGHWYLDIVKNRQHHLRSLHMKIAKGREAKAAQRRVVEELRLKVELQEFRGEFSLTDFDARRRSLKEYILEVAEGSKSKECIVKMSKWMDKYNKNNISIGGVDVDFVNGFKRFLETSTAQKTAHTYFAMLKLVMKKATLDGIITINPCDKVKGVANCTVEKDTLTAEELRRLDNTQCDCKHFDIVKRAFLFACNTGMRISDLQTLMWGDLEKTDKGWMLHKKQVKTGGYVDGVLNGKAVALIEADKAEYSPNEAVFEELSEVSRSATNAVIKKWVAAAGIDKCVSWHTARRTFATLLLEAGADVFTTQRLMGHATVQMTSVYAKSSAEVKARAVAALEVLEKN